MADPRNAQPGSYGPSGYGAEGRERSRVAPDPGRGRVRSSGPGAPNPAGWSPSPAGEAAPPVRHRGLARLDAPSPYDVETRPTAIYQIPWRSPRPENGQGPLRTPQPPAARPRRRPPEVSEANRGAPDSLWPALIRQPPRRIPVVGPMEALRIPGAVGAPAAVPVVLGHGNSTGWQLAQRVWEESGVKWEAPPAGDPDDWYPADPCPTRPDLPVLPDPAPGEPGLPPVTPQLSRRIRRATPVWSDHPAGTLGERAAHSRIAQASPLPPPAAASSAPFATSAFTPASPFAPAPAFAAPRSYEPAAAFGAPAGFTPAPLSAPVAPPLSGPDELFRAWQGSVDEAAGRRAPRAARRQGRVNGASARGRGWQVAKIGVPAAVIVTVGAGALMMLTGRANDMLAERASSGALSSGTPASGPVASGQASVGPSSLARTSTLTLAGYPAERGSVGVAAMWSAGGITMAVGYADGHPAVWRHAADGSWSLVSTAVLGGVTGHLTAVAQGPSGWIAVGSVQANGTAAPAVFASADGVAWRQLTGLTALAGGNAQFLGVAAGQGGYLVVGKQGTGSQQAVALWWSADLENWVNGASSRPAGSVATAAVATAAGFVAVGSENGCHTFWTSGDGQHWTAHDLAKPNGATAATLTSVAAGQGGQADRFVAAGVATTSAGDLPIVVTAANDGTHISQTVLSSAGGPGTATAVTATASGFLAAGAVGPANAHHAVTWTSTEGRIWTPAAPLQAAGNSEITALATPSTGTTLTATAQQGANPAIFTFPAP